MTFFCYVYSRDTDVPHMEALGSATLADAMTRARRMLDEHGATLRAELYHDDQRVAVIAPDEVDPARATA